VAEDLAIRHADDLRGPHSGHFEGMAEYGRLRDQYMEEQFKSVAARHGVSEAQVRESLTHRPPGVDLLVMLSFAALYALIAGVVARQLHSIVMTAYVSIVLSAASVLLGEQWAGLVESLRLGTGHLSYRADRIPWSHHRLSLFVACVALYWFVAIVRSRRVRALA
jgi:hypothetical protein